MKFSAILSLLLLALTWEFAYECFKRAPDGSLTVDAQVAKFSESELNVGKPRTDAERCRIGKVGAATL